MRNYSRLLKDCEVFVGLYVSHHNFSVLTFNSAGVFFIASQIALKIPRAAW